MSLGHAYTVVPAHKTDAKLSQAAAQNTWYTVLDTARNVRVIGILANMATTGEDISIRITIDGVVIEGSVSAVAGTTYFADAVQSFGGGGTILALSGSPILKAFLLEGRSVKIEIRKTTAAGAGTLHCFVTYAQY